MLHWQNMDAEARSLVKAFMKQQGVQESLLYQGMVVVLAGAFEEFVRRLLHDSVVALASSTPNYDELDAALKAQNVYRTGIALTTVFEPPDHLDINYEVLCRNIGTCTKGSSQHLLNAQAFTIFLATISPKNLTDALKRIGLKLNWDDIGRAAGMQTVLQTTKTRETSEATQHFLAEFAKKRNKIAHGGGGTIVIVAEDVEQFLDVFRAFARTLEGVVGSFLQKQTRPRK